MHLIWLLSLLLLYAKFIMSVLFERDVSTHGWLERHHYPGYYAPYMTVYINGTDTAHADRTYTPDYRVEEVPLTVKYYDRFHEQERPYRITPAYKQLSRWTRDKRPIDLGCYCVTTYRRHVTLAGCAVVTTRHILTTATPTELILRSYGHLKTLENILGGWYETNQNLYNASAYFTPSRIHIHPMYRYDYEVNVSHPLPVMYDLSVWAATCGFFYNFFSKAIICERGVSSWFEYAVSIPRAGDMSAQVGSQFMKAWKRRPLPWFKFALRSRKYVWPCPKADWHWYHCTKARWARYGFDSGGALHLFSSEYNLIGGRANGLIGLCAFSMRLRSDQIINYFTVIDTYPVLDFMYDAFLGRQPYKYLDDRFEDTQWAAPRLWWGSPAIWAHNPAYNPDYTNEWLMNYRR